MELLNFRLPNFCRTAWTSNKAREVWEIRLKRISNAWHEIEWLSVAEEMRSCALCQITPENLANQAAHWMSKGLYSVPLQISNVGHYSSYSVKPDTTKSISIRSVVGKPDSLAQFHKAWNDGDQLVIGKLLGYPSCCISFFEEVWVNKSQIDTTWAMCGPVEGHCFSTGLRHETVYANILWRWMGVRFVPHLPCSFDCSESCRTGEAYEHILRKYGYGNEANWMREILTWPIEWSSLHGIAEIKTPILKVSTNTDPTGVKHTVRLDGLAMPREKGDGSSFPWNVTPSPEKEISQFKVSSDEMLESETWYVTDNGFNSRVRMYEEHEIIIAAFRNLSGMESDARFSIIDLGCGNGALLKRLKQNFPGANVFGVETESERIAHAPLLHPQCDERFKRMNMFDLDEGEFNEYFDFAFLMPGRLLEVNLKTATAFLSVLRSRVKRLIVYAYGDTLAKHGGLDQLCESVGLRIVTTEGSVGVAEYAENILAG